MTPKVKEFSAESEQGRFNILIEESGSEYILEIRRYSDGASQTVQLNTMSKVKAALSGIALEEKTIRMVENFFSTSSKN